MTDRTIIGQRIAELRKAKGLTQAELADLIGVSHQAVSQWERNETLPDILTIPALAELFGESVSAIMGMEELKNKNNTENTVSDDESSFDDSKPEPEFTAEYTERTDTDSDGNTDGDCEKNDNIEIHSGKGNRTIDLTKDEYEIVVRKNGQEITSFKNDPDRFIKIVIKNDIYSLKSSLGVTVEGNVLGNAQSGFGMSIGGCVGGDVKSGFETKCGDVAGNVNAGFSVNCGHVGGEAKGVLGINSSDKKNSGEHGIANTVKKAIGAIGNAFADDDDDDKDDVKSGSLNDSSDTITLDGDVHDDIADCVNVIVNGNIYGDITDCQNVTVHGDCSGDIEAGGDVTVEGDCGGDIDTSGDVKVGGDCDGDIDAGEDVTVDGDCDGDIDAGGDVTVDGDCDGDIDAGGSVKVTGDVSGDIDASKVTVHGKAPSYDEDEDDDD